MVPSEGGKITPNLIKKMMAKGEELGKDPNAHRTNQFYNKHSLKGYKRIGEEILTELEGKVDAFVASVGTAAPWESQKPPPAVIAVQRVRRVRLRQA